MIAKFVLNIPNYITKFGILRGNMLSQICKLLNEVVKFRTKVPKYQTKVLKWMHLVAKVKLYPVKFWNQIIEKYLSNEGIANILPKDPQYYWRFFP